MCAARGAHSGLPPPPPAHAHSSGRGSERLPVTASASGPLHGTMRRHEPSLASGVDKTDPHRALSAGSTPAQRQQDNVAWPHAESSQSPHEPGSSRPGKVRRRISRRFPTVCHTRLTSLAIRAACAGRTGRLDWMVWRERPASRHMAKPMASIHTFTSIEPAINSTLAATDRPSYACKTPATNDTLPPSTAAQPSSREYLPLTTSTKP
jgi:hypothetical protein